MGAAASAPDRHVAIVGAGITGLEVARRLTHDHGIRVTIFEKHHRRLGGRAYDIMFQGVNIHQGAGIILGEQTRAVEWLHERKAELREFQTSWHLAPCVQGQNDKLHAFRSAVYERLTPRELATLTVKQAAIRLFGKTWWTELLSGVPYTDFQESDVVDFVEDYPLSDLLTDTRPHVAYNVKWTTDVVENLKKDLLATGLCTFRMHHQVTRITQNHTLYAGSQNLGTFTAVVCTVPVTAYDTLRIDGARYRPQDVLAPIPFERAYGHFTKDLPADVANNAIVTGAPERKIIGLGSKHVLMISYADSEEANVFHETHATRAGVCGRSLADEYNMDEVVWKYWKCGTHCWRPRQTGESREALLQQLTELAPGVFVCGEGWSRIQGWVAGCLDSVDRLFAHPAFQRRLDTGSAGYL